VDKASWAEDTMDFVRQSSLFLTALGTAHELRDSCNKGSRSTLFVCMHRPCKQRAFHHSALAQRASWNGAVESCSFGTQESEQLRSSTKPYGEADKDEQRKRDRGKVRPTFDRRTGSTWCISVLCCPSFSMEGATATSDSQQFVSAHTAVKGRHV